LQDSAVEPAAQDGPPIDVPAYCRSRGIAYLETGPLDSADAVALRLGVLNARWVCCRPIAG
jgi:hypothetical protein